MLIFGLMMGGMSSAWGQTNATLTGKVMDAEEKQPLIGATVLVVFASDSTRYLGGTTDANGDFRIQAIPNGRYRLKISSIGYQSFSLPLIMDGTAKNMGELQLKPEATMLKDVAVEATIVRTEQLGDTTQYNAKAFKTNPDANAEDLVTKMPGITVENGTVKAQGENVRRVTVDGREFFGDDATAALRNLPAEVIDKVQVFDRLSDQAQFTGFDDGNAERTINIVTKPGMNNGQFGRVYAGYGTNERFSAGGNVSYFNGNQRISLIGLSNNINQQNFSSQDLLGVVGPTSTRGPGGFGGGGGGRRDGGGGIDASNFLVGQQGGINTTHSFGVNYANKFGKNLDVQGSYFFNQTDNDNASEIGREFFLNNGGSQFYNESNRSDSRNMNHRLSARIEYRIDSANSIILRPNISLQDNTVANFLTGRTFLASGEDINTTDTRNGNDRNGYNFNNFFLFRHQFAKRGRTYSIGLRTVLTDNEGNGTNYSLNQFFNSNQDDLLLDQINETLTKGTTWSPSFTYTEPIGKSGQLQWEYNPSFNRNDSEKLTQNLDPERDTYSILDSILSNNFANRTTTQRGGMSYRYRKPKFSLSIGLNYQQTLLESDQTFPQTLTVSKTFRNVIPFAFITFGDRRKDNFRIFYRPFANLPSISQLQNVVNNSNPLQLRAGNPGLRQEFTHSLNLRYNKTIADKGQTILGYVSANYVQDYIGTSTIIAEQPLEINGVTLPRGGQYSAPANLGNNWNLRSFVSYGLPLKPIKSNVNLNVGFSYNQAPGLINGVENLSNTFNYNGGLVISSSISERVDFTLSYSANQNQVENSLRPELNNNYFFHLATARVNLMPWKGLVLNSDIAQTYYTGLGDGFNQNFFLWNAGIGYKFLKDQAGELRLSAFDLLGQNNSISRTVGETYIEDNITRVLQRYYLLTFAYRIRNFNKAKT